MEGTAIETRRPALDLIRCSDCEACLDLCPELFQRNPETGRIEVMDLPEYPEEAVAEVMAVCPRDCIEWEHDG
ncbi:MAG: ferredoxin [Deltaproteobacteria bacterium]|nr:ferredoxin [Deltaproteobacteria bacterium]